jgi:hypothetical protein
LRQKGKSICKNLEPRKGRAISRECRIFSKIGCKNIGFMGDDVR